MGVIRLMYWLGNTFVNGKGVQGCTRVGKNSAVWKMSQYVHSYKPQTPLCLKKLLQDSPVEVNSGSSFAVLSDR